MKDFKTLPKMACGGGVKNYEIGGDVAPAPRQNFATRKPTNIAEVQAEAAATAKPFIRKPVALKTGGFVKRKK
jgi:hypothetical protein